MAKRPSSVVRPPPADARPPNRLLRALPAAEWRRLMPDMETISVRTKQVLYRPGDPHPTRVGE